MSVNATYTNDPVKIILCDECDKYLCTANSMLLLRLYLIDYLVLVHITFHSIRHY